MSAAEHKKLVWKGRGLTDAAFSAYAERLLSLYKGCGYENIALAELGPQFEAAYDRLFAAINRQRSFDETADVMRADADRDALARFVWHGWKLLRRLSPTNPLYEHVARLRSEMPLVKGVWRTERSNETSKINALRDALATDENRAALAALGLDKAAAALFAANDAFNKAHKARMDERCRRLSERVNGSTRQLRAELAALVAKTVQRVEAANLISPTATTANALQRIRAVVEDFRNVAAHTGMKRTKGTKETERDVVCL